LGLGYKAGSSLSDEKNALGLGLGGNGVLTAALYELMEDAGDNGV
jgi:hypothetical protein